MRDFPKVANLEAGLGFCHSSPYSALFRGAMEDTCHPGSVFPGLIIVLFSELRVG